MAKEFYAKYNPGKKYREILDYITTLVSEYSKRGMALTVRQIYYKVISVGYLADLKTPYTSLSQVLTKARNAGLLDWNAIEDPTREHIKPSEWDNVSEILESALSWYRLPRWEGQDYYIEVIIEKQTLVTALEPITRNYHIALNVFHGNGSTTAMYDLAKRAKMAVKKKQKVILVYIGDHDPSGYDMIKSIEERMKLYAPTRPFKLLPIALTMEQIDSEHLKPIATKAKYTKKHDYIKQFGKNAWEVDALKPEILNELVKSTIHKYIDGEKMNAVIAREDEDKAELQEFVEKNF